MLETLKPIIEYLPHLFQSMIMPVLISLLLGIIFYYKQKNIDYSYDVKISEIKSELDKSKEVGVLLNTIMTQDQVQRQKIINEKRLEAIDKLWIKIKSLDKIAAHASSVSIVKLDNVYDILGKNEHTDRRNLMDFFNETFDGVNIYKDFKQYEGIEEIYIPQNILKIYKLYSMQCMCTFSLIAAGQDGIDPREFLTFQKINSDISKNFPDLGINLDNKYSFLEHVDYTKVALSETIRGFIEEADTDYKKIKDRADESIRKRPNIDFSSVKNYVEDD